MNAVFARKGLHFQAAFYDINKHTVERNRMNVVLVRNVFRSIIFTKTRKDAFTVQYLWQSNYSTM